MDMSDNELSALFCHAEGPHETEVPSLILLGSTKFRVVRMVFPDQNMDYLHGKRHETNKFDRFLP